jgi:SAM-dependent methyltransferase
LSPRKKTGTSPDPYAPIADIYDFSYEDFTEDVDFYENLAQAVDGAILELGAGTGRVAIPLAEAGYEVVGIDTSATMLARARANLEATKLPKGASVELFQADMTSFDLGRKFGLVVVAANTLQHLLTTRDQRDCFERVRTHLDVGGMFSFSVRSPLSVEWDDNAHTPLLFEWARVDPDSGETVMKMVAGHAYPERQVRQWTYIYDRVAADGIVRRSVFATELRYSSQAELTLLLQQCGFRVTHVYGDYDLAPVGQGDNLVFVARAEDPR